MSASAEQDVSEAAQAQGVTRRVTRDRVVRVMLARLFLTVGALALALTLVGAGRLHEQAEAGLYGTLTAAFAVSLVYAAVVPWVRRLGLFARFQLGADLLLVTALVGYSGGADSIFSFLYLPIVVFGALLFHKVGAYAAAIGGSLGFGLAILAAAMATQAGFGVIPTELSFALWGVHTGAMLLVALFASGLSLELQLAGERLEESATDLAELRTLHVRTVESLTSGVLTTDDAGDVTSFNPEAARITGRSTADALGKPLSEVLPGIESVSVDESTRRSRARFRFVDPRGTERFLGVSISELHPLADGGLPERRVASRGQVVIFQDVTEVVRMEAALSRSARLAGIGELSASIAHEIRNPLAAISGSVEMLRSSLPAEVLADGQGTRLMDIVLREIDRLNHLITDFLQYARPAPATLAPVDLGALVAQVVEAFGAAVRGDVELEFEQGDPTWVQGDSKQLQQVLWNLLGNAQEAIEGKGRIAVRVRPLGAGSQERIPGGRQDGDEGPPTAELLVSDTGSGIEDDALERVFDPFFTTRSEGTGLGLATVHRIVESHGGTVQVMSAKGQGTDFVIRFPLGSGDDE